jgi:hypothetical protein
MNLFLRKKIKRNELADKYDENRMNTVFPFVPEKTIKNAKTNLCPEARTKTEKSLFIIDP